jgi:hypothetical protein
VFVALSAVALKELMRLSEAKNNKPSSKLSKVVRFFRIMRSFERTISTFAVLFTIKRILAGFYRSGYLRSATNGKCRNSCSTRIGSNSRGTAGPDPEERAPPHHEVRYFLAFATSVAVTAGAVLPQALRI